MNYENQLAVDSVLPCLQNRIEQLSLLVQRMEKSLAHAPEGRLRLSRHGKHMHCYHVKSKGSSDGAYISKKNMALVQKLAQKDYDECLLKEFERELKILDFAIAGLGRFELDKVFTDLPDFRRKLVRPLFLPKEEYVSQWLSVSFSKKYFAEDSPVLMTSRGERVRSKSEVIIADTLARLRIPYRYEFPMNVQAENARPICVHPDFTCLNVRLRKEFIWEHLGMMDLPEYSTAAIRKIKTYRRNGFFIGDRIIVSEETSEEPLSSTEVELLARQYLL